MHGELCEGFQSLAAQKHAETYSQNSGQPCKQAGRHSDEHNTSTITGHKLYELPVMTDDTHTNTHMHKRRASSREELLQSLGNSGARVVRVILHLIGQPLGQPEGARISDHTCAVVA